MNFPDKGATAADKTVKLEGNGKAAKKSVKFQVSKAVKQERFRRYREDVGDT